MSVAYVGNDVVAAVVAVADFLSLTRVISQQLKPKIEPH